MDEAKGRLLPVYFVADDSGSMKPVVGELNLGLRSLLDVLATDPMSAAKIRFTVLSFSGDVLTHLEMVDLRDVEAMPTFTARNNTCYSAAFRDLRGRIDRDVDRLKSDGYQVHRPAVFFLSDGEPDQDDPWSGSLAALKDLGWSRRPNIVAFGIGESRPATINEVASRPELGWIANSGAETGTVLMNFFELFTHSLMNSAKNPGELTIDKPQGFTMAVDLI